MWSKLTFRTRKQELWIARVWSHPSLALGEKPDPELLQFKLGGLPALGAMISHKGHSHDGSLLRLTVDASRWQSAFGWQWPHVASPGKKPVAKDWAKPTSGSSTLSAIFINFQQYSLLPLWGESKPCTTLKTIFPTWLAQCPAVPCSWFHHLPHVAKPQKDGTSPLQSRKLLLNQNRNFSKRNLSWDPWAPFLLKAHMDSHGLLQRIRWAGSKDSSSCTKGARMFLSRGANGSHCLAILRRLLIRLTSSKISAYHPESQEA